MTLYALTSIALWTSQSAPFPLPRRLDAVGVNPTHYGPPAQVGGQCMDDEHSAMPYPGGAKSYVCSVTGCSSDSDCPTDLPHGTKGSITCDNGFCMILCQSDDDCGVGMFCETHGHANKCAYDPNRDCYYIQNVVGKWNPISSSPSQQHVSFKVWTDVGYSVTDTQTWGTSVEVKASEGFKVAGIGETVDVSGTSSENTSRAYSSTFSQHSETDFTYDFAAGVVWQWSFDITSPCGKSTTSGHDLALTPSNLDPPCCLPGMFANITDPTGGCKGGTPYLCGTGNANAMSPCMTKECTVVQH